MLIHNATVLTFDDDNRVLADGAVCYRGDEIVAVGGSRELLERFPTLPRWDAQGLLLMPGQICAHTHFYGAFARGMYIPGAPAKDFPEILQKLWWPLDRALDLAGVESSAEVCLVDAIRNGTTTLIDHHASQTASTSWAGSWPRAGKRQERRDGSTRGQGRRRSQQACHRPPQRLLSACASRSHNHSRRRHRAAQ